METLTGAPVLPEPDIFDLDLRILPRQPGEVPLPQAMPTGGPACPVSASTCAFTCTGTTGSPCAC